MKKPFFSIVVPTYSEEENLPHLLSSLKKQTFSDYEVIVADNASPDKTAEIARSFGAKVVKGANRPGIGRNNGAEEAQGEYLVFFDADTTFNSNFLSDLSAEIKKRKFGVASGFFAGDEGGILDKLGYFVLNYYFWLLQKVDPHAYGFYFVVQSDLFKKVKGFDPIVVMAEDHELAARLKKETGAKYSFLRRPVIIASVRRVNREGFWSTLYRGLYVEVYRLFNKKITKKLFDYRMGGGEGKLPE